MSQNQKQRLVRAIFTLSLFLVAIAVSACAPKFNKTASSKLAALIAYFKGGDRADLGVEGGSAGKFTSPGYVIKNAAAGGAALQSQGTSAHFKMSGGIYHP